MSGTRWVIDEGRAPASMLSGWDHHRYNTLKMGSPDRHHLWQGHWHSQTLPDNSARGRISQWLHLGARTSKKGQEPCRYHRVTELGDWFMSVCVWDTQELPKLFGKGTLGTGVSAESAKPETWVITIDKAPSRSTFWFYFPYISVNMWSKANHYDYRKVQRGMTAKLNGLVCNPILRLVD